MASQPGHDLFPGLCLRATAFHRGETIERNPVPFSFHLGGGFAVHFRTEAVKQFSAELTRESPGF